MITLIPVLLVEEELLMVKCVASTTAGNGPDGQAKIGETAHL